MLVQMKKYNCCSPYIELIAAILNETLNITSSGFFQETLIQNFMKIGLLFSWNSVTARQAAEGWLFSLNKLITTCYPKNFENCMFFLH